MKSAVVLDLVGCARCEGDGHPGLTFRKLAHPIVEGGGKRLTHWAPCPTTHEPILMGLSAVKAKVPTEVWVLPRPRKDCYVGSFPLHFEQKLWKLMGSPAKVLHPFGGLAEIGDSVDLNATTTPTFVGDAHDMNWIADGEYDLTILDPPYSDEESYWLYNTPPLKPGKYIAEAVRVTRVGGHVAIYHVRQPTRPNGTKLVQRVVVLTRANHTARICFVFEKLPEGATA